MSEIIREELLAYREAAGLLCDPLCADFRGMLTERSTGSAFVVSKLRGCPDIKGLAAAAKLMFIL